MLKYTKTLDKIKNFYFGFTTVSNPLEAFVFFFTLVSNIFIVQPNIFAAANVSCLGAVCICKRTGKFPLILLYCSLTFSASLIHDHVLSPQTSHFRWEMSKLFFLLLSQWTRTFLKEKKKKKSPHLRHNGRWCTAGVRLFVDLWFESSSSLATLESWVLSGWGPRAHLLIWNEDIVGGQAESTAEVLRWESLWWARHGPSLKRLKSNSVRVKLLPAAQWLPLCPSDCPPALTRARASPPFLHEMPCVLVCTRWSEPHPDCRCRGATSVSPGRCLLRTHRSPRSQRSARVGKTGSGTTISAFEPDQKWQLFSFLAVVQDIFFNVLH